MEERVEEALFLLGAVTVYIGAAIFGLFTGKWLGEFFARKWRDHPRSI